MADAISHLVRTRPAGTNGGLSYVVTMNPASDGGYPVNFTDWVKAAVFIDGLKRGVVDQAAFR